MTVNHAAFNPGCTDCARLSKALKEIRNTYPCYHARPVPAFGVKNPTLFIVGLAPGLHGANATGRPFTGDFAGIMLYKMLYKHGFSNQSQSKTLNDGLKLKQCRISNAVKCWPPDNKPTAAEICNCNRYLVAELAAIDKNAVILCLGHIAHNAVVRALALRRSDYRFAHGKNHTLGDNDGRIIADSYHCSRYNTNTRRLTAAMFDTIFTQIKTLLDR